MSTPIRVSWLGLHPVKSTAIRPVTRVRVGPAGLDGDRRWMITDASGDLVSARELHTLFGIVADIPATDPALGVALRMRSPSAGSIDIDEPRTGLVGVTVHGQPLQARPVPGVGEWLRRATGRPGLGLVWCDDPTRRVLNPAYARPGDHTGFADGYPVTLVSTASMDQLNDWIAAGAAARGEDIAAPLPIQRFRPNIVVEAATPFAEDGWDRVTIGGVAFRKVKLVDRCVMTTISVADLHTGPEPIRTLAQHRRWDGKTWFAVHLVPEGDGTLTVGDEAIVG